MSSIALAEPPDDVADSPYEWHQHRRMAREEGLPGTQVAELEMWRTSTAFDSPAEGEVMAPAGDGLPRHDG